MRIIIVVFFLILFNGFSKAQSISFNGGDKLFSINSGYFTKLYTGDQFKTMLPPMALHFDMCIIDSIGKTKQAVGIGAIVNLNKAKTEYSNKTTGVEGVIYHIWSFGLRPSYHYYVKRKTDLYAGFIIWYIHQDMARYGPIEKVPPTDSMSGLKLSYYAGFRYYFNKQFAFYCEWEYWVTQLNTGFTFRFR